MASLLSYALCSVSDVKENLGIVNTDTSKDSLIIRKINQATEMIEGYTGRRFTSATYTEYYDGTLDNQLVLKQRPVTAVTSLSARSTTLNTANFDPVDSTNYYIDSSAGILSGVSNFYGTYDRWQVVYVAGYTTIPSDLAEACATLAAYLVAQAIRSVLSSSGESVGAVKRQTEGSRSVEYFNADEGGQSGGQGGYRGSNSIIEYLNIDETLSRYANTVIVGLV